MPGWTPPPRVTKAGSVAAGCLAPAGLSLAIVAPAPAYDAWAWLLWGRELPLLYAGLVTAALLVFVEVLKELPATALLRPLNGDTLAVAVWEATKDSCFDTAALPALLIVLVGLVPVVALMRASRPGD